MNLFRKIQSSQWPKSQPNTQTKDNSNKQNTITINLSSTSNSINISNIEKTEFGVSVVVPCLNEEQTIGECIKKSKTCSET